MHPLKSYCEQHDVALCRLAERVGVADTTLSRLVRFERRPSGALMAKIEAATDGEVTAAQLLCTHFLPGRQSVDGGAHRNKTFVNRSNASEILPDGSQTEPAHDEAEAA